MPKRTYTKRATTIPRAEGEAIKRTNVWIREVDLAYLKKRYGTVAKGVRDLVTADRRAYENATYKP